MFTVSGENKASTEQTFDIEEIKKDIEKKKTHNQSVLQEKESKTKNLLRYNTAKQTDTTLNQDQMEEFTNGGKEVKSREQMFNVEDINVTVVTLQALSYDVHERPSTSR